MSFLVVGIKNGEEVEFEMNCSEEEAVRFAKNLVDVDGCERSMMTDLNQLQEWNGEPDCVKNNRSLSPLQLYEQERFSKFPF